MEHSYRSKRNLFVLGFSITILGTGFVYPLTAIFLDRVYDLSPSQIAVYFALVALSAFLSGLVAGVVADNHGADRVAIVGVLLQFSGAVVVGMSEELSLVLLGAVYIGIGNGAFFSVQTPLFLAIFGEERLARVFALEYVVMNVAVAAAGASSGFVIARTGETGFRTAFVVNGITFLIYGAILLYLLDTSNAARSRGSAERQRVDRLRMLDAIQPFRDPRFLPLLLVHLAFTACGFAQMDAVLPLVLTSDDVFPLAVVGAFLAVNGVAVVLMQRFATPVVERIGFVPSLAVVALSWLLAFAVGMLAYVAQIGDVARISLLMAFSVLFAVGEVFLAPSLQPLAVAIAPRDRIGTYSASLTTVFNVGLVVGPVLSLPIYDAVGGSLYWLVPIAGMIAASVLVAVTRKVIAGSPHVDAAPA